jgi:hypothetical protein
MSLRSLRTILSFQWSVLRSSFVMFVAVCVVTRFDEHNLHLSFNFLPILPKKLATVLSDSYDLCCI